MKLNCEVRSVSLFKGSIFNCVKLNCKVKAYVCLKDRYFTERILIVRGET